MSVPVVAAVPSVGPASVPVIPVVDAPVPVDPPPLSPHAVTSTTNDPNNPRLLSIATPLHLRTDPAGASRSHSVRRASNRHILVRPACEVRM
ncbi:MAG: hypothetical protein JNL82_35610 [Myxococcales bacterium]|nr:hypothetical protein [Myxococcales bacterium]